MDQLLYSKRRLNKDHLLLIQCYYRRKPKLTLISLYVCMAIKHIIVLFVETPRKFIRCSNKFTWCFHKQNYYKLTLLILDS